MTPEQFRHAGRRTIDWIAHYLETIERHPVLSRVAPGEIRRRLPPRAPERGRSEEHTSELQSPCNLVCRLLLEKKKNSTDISAVHELHAYYFLLLYCG